MFLNFFDIQLFKGKISTKLEAKPMKIRQIFDYDTCFKITKYDIFVINH
jgi:hypothetical protein